MATECHVTDQLAHVHVRHGIVLCVATNRNHLPHHPATPHAPSASSNQRHYSLATYILLRGLTLLVRTGNKPRWGRGVGP